MHLSEGFSLLSFLLDIPRLSQSVVQGFTCAAAGAVGAERFQELAKVMRRKNVRLGQDQVIFTCLRVWCCPEGTRRDSSARATPGVEGLEQGFVRGVWDGF